MRSAATHMIPLADNLPVVYNDSPHHRIRCCAIKPVACQLYATGHVFFVCCHIQSDKNAYFCPITITEMNASFKYIFDKLSTAYPEREARAIARLVLETRFGLTPIDICMGRERTFSLEERRDLENIVKRLSQKEPVQYVLGQADFLWPHFLRGSGVSLCRAPKRKN